MLFVVQILKLKMNKTGNSVSINFIYATIGLESSLHLISFTAGEWLSGLNPS